MANISEYKKNEITETAVMQSISQNKYVEEWFEKPPKSDYVKKWFNEHPGEKPTFQTIMDAHPKTQNADMQILRDFCSSPNHKASNYVIEDCTSFGDGNGKSVLISNGTNAYVAFDGTGKNGWIDNGQGLYMESTKLQRDAADRFDQYCHDYPNLMKSENNVVVTGHSKGGNKAMYVTMSAKNSNLIDSCVALDGQGFSKAAIEKWQKQYSPEVYANKINKISLVSGKYDFVHELGIPIAGHTYTVDYSPWHGLDNKLDELFSFHTHDSMFIRGSDNTLTLSFDCKPGPQEALLNQFMKEYMNLSPEEIEGSAPQLMSVMELITGGGVVSADGELVLPEMTGVLWALAKTSLGKKLVALMLPILISYAPGLEGALAAYVIQLGLKMIRNGVRDSISDRIGASSGSQVIMLNVESLNSLNSSFQITFNEAADAAQYAEKAESVQHNMNICGSLARDISKKSEDIQEIMRKVIESFTTVDRENAKAARAIGESFLGSDMYSMISSQ